MNVLYGYAKSLVLYLIKVMEHNEGIPWVANFEFQFITIQTILAVSEIRAEEEY